MILHIPHNVQTVEMLTSLIWFDKDGILYSVPKENRKEVISEEEIKSDMKKFRELIGHKKVCIIIESSPRHSSPPKQQRDLIAEEIASVTKAMAIVTSSPLSRMAANLFFSFKPPGFPYRMCSTEREAIEWMKQYL